MNSIRAIVVSMSLLALAATPIFAQHVISAKGGLIHYTEGKILINNQVLEPKFGIFPLLKEDDRVQTEKGRVEIFFVAGMFLRMSENGELRVVLSKIFDTHLELSAGSVIVEYVGKAKNNVFVIKCGGAVISLLKDGLYRLDADSATFQVYKGKARVEFRGKTVIAGKGKQVVLNDVFVLAKFDSKKEDDFSRWNRRRTERLTMASFYTAKSIYNKRMPQTMSGWLWDPYLGIITYVPFGNNYCDFYGYCYWSPREAYGGYKAPRTDDYSSTPTAPAGIPPTSSGTSGATAISGLPSSGNSTVSAPRPSGQAGGQKK